MALRKKVKKLARRKAGDALLKEQLAEARAQQAATAKILKVIASSPNDVQPVFDAIVQTAKRLIGAFSATVTRVGDGMLHLVAHTATTPEGEAALNKYFPIAIEGNPMGRAILLRRPAFVDDFEADTDDAANGRELARSRGFRSVGFVPLLRGDVAIGSLNVTRREPGRMTDHHIGLLETFASQAVIAIENVRLFNETKEALERQTATAEILKVIASSPNDVQPVFDAIAASARRLLDGGAALVARRNGDQLELAAYTSTSATADETLRKLFPAPITGQGHLGQAILSAAPVRISDIQTDERYSESFRAMARTRGLRGVVSVPMLREGEPIGVISVNRPVAGEFSDHQTNLLRTFADQAVIAIENVRLFNETKEALERQTATAEILKVMAGSPTDVTPVFEAIVRSACNLTGAEIAAVFPYDGELVHLGATHNWSEEALRYFSGVYPAPPSPALMSGRTILAGSVVTIEDATADRKYDPDSAKTGHWRRMLGVPMLREGRACGAIVVCWRDPGQTPQREVDLLQTFADQAVIAIENVRLFNETKESLERQTATAEILKVIASSPSDVQPVFDAIAGAAIRLIGGFSCAVTRVEGEYLHLAAYTSTARTQAGDDALIKIYPLRIADAVVQAEVVRTGKTKWIADVESFTPALPHVLEMARIVGFKSVVHVPLVRDGAVIGLIHVARAQTGPYSTHHTDLLKTFADQAVIAIENVRLFNETKEALERQTATAEILRVISRSPDDVQPVLEAVASSAARLCEAKDVTVLLREGDQLRYRVHHGDIATGVPVGGTKPISRDWGAGRCTAEGRQLHIHDILASPEEFPEGSRMGKHAGYRTVLMTPLLREGIVLGVIGMRRSEVRPFEPRQIELINTFADQAVIAIENVRLFNETKEALERQTATAEILRVISRSPTDVRPVFECIVRSAVRLTNATATGSLFTLGGGMVDIGWIDAAPDSEGFDLYRRAYPMPIGRNVPAMAAMRECRVVNVPDLAASEFEEGTKARARAGGYQSALCVPMLRDGSAIGAIAVSRREPGLFGDHLVALLQSFADQAVIAIENVRLFKELQSRTDALTKSVGQLTALGEVGQAISSTLDLDTVLQTIVARAVQLTGLDTGGIYEYDEGGEQFTLRAAQNMSEEVVEVLRSNPIRKGEGAVGTTAVTREPVQVADIQAEGYQGRLRDILLRSGRRAVLAVPLLREDHIIGALAVQRSTPGPFPPEVVELLRTFATQSAMAIQNARLFREIAEKGKQLEEASRHKSNFLASMSHELRTPLNAILGFNEMILGQVYGEVPADMQEPLTDIQTSGKHLLRLINNVLDLAKIEAGRMELSLQDYSVHDTVASVHSTLRPLAAEKGLEFVTTVPNDVPLAHGDGGRMAQCLINLAGNSLKFTKAGKVEIAVELKSELLVYKVSDTGIGIPPDKIGSLFTEFKQTDATIASEYGGTGLGLSISRKFVEMHGGRIWVESEMGKGSTFIIEVPLRVTTP